MKHTFNWYAIHTRSRHEFKVVDRLMQNGVEVFLPTVERISVWKDRKKKIAFPLFPGYLFVRIIPTYETLITVLQTIGVVCFLGIKPLEPEAVGDNEINSLKLIVDNKYEVDPYPFLKKGQRVRVKRGALMGVEGFLVEKSGKHSLVLSVDVLKEGIALKIDASDVEAID